jgi:midasin
MLPLSKIELEAIVCQNYTKLSTIASRIVDVFLIFSSGCHTAGLEVDDSETLSSIKAKRNTQSIEALPYANNMSTLGVTNSGRMVSTRDMIKLCERSNINFQVTSTECAYIVFQNCVDLFCSHLPDGELKTNLIISIGARLGIIETRCLHLANEMKPNVKFSSDEITIGRVALPTNKIEKSSSDKKVKLDQNVESIKNKIPPPTFSFTRVSACVLERISVAVKHNEPILLVGETGAGKTSSVQYLSYQTNHKLVVVNMNNQSDVSDLIGGFKPVDVSFIISPLRSEFEKLFIKTFDITKNEKFLSHVAGCFNRSDFNILIKLMLKVISNAYKICKEKPKMQKEIIQWEVLEKKLKKLDQQFKKTINLSFAFIPGSLVNCIKNGDWVLLDEINLASTETLECLSTILEPDGSIILLESGDFVPIKRHPDFRIFACMNPSTDVGKKDLPVGIRNRFTEFFVDELTNENDLLILVGDYLNNTGIEKSRIHKTVQLYKELRKLSQLELNDGLGNKPVFSLRTLCRALRTCAKNICGSIERNIYESFCLSFLTQLDTQSHNLVLQKIQKYLVSDVKMVLSKPIPKPPGEQLNFEGYWIENGGKVVQECKEYILTESVQKNLKDLARIISIGKLPILLQGPTSAGKTSLIEYIAKKSGNHCLRINNHEHTDLQEYVGTYATDASGKLSFQEGVLVKAMRYGYWIILDELNLAPSDILEALNRVLDDNRELYIPETQVLVKAHPKFMLFATQNPPGLYGGRKTLSRAFKNRFIELHFADIPKTELEIILEKRCLIPMKYAQKMVKTMTALQVNRRTTTRNVFTLRDLFRWGNRYTYANTKLLDDRNYDWNQHLVDEGYLVLSAKVRNEIENEIIVDTLYKNFSKKISIENLFSLSENTSKVTKDILESLSMYKGLHNVVWTFAMRRMAVLVSKSLQFHEPVLLVGLSGGGKTTVCQILAELMNKQLRILNCHMHTESADFLGGLRPCRDFSEEKNENQLFEWSDGPLVHSMIEGNFFLADEISLAEDSVLERLNCVLEPERTLLLAEKCGLEEKAIRHDSGSELIIKATEGFQFLATMNPGGDFGKKELSPALRNRFTEIWCTAICSDEDFLKIAVNSLEKSFNCKHNSIVKIGEIVVSIINVLRKKVDKLNFSIRDLLAWINYIVKNFDLNSNDNSKSLNLNETLFYGLHTIFLDSFEMLPYENFNDIVELKSFIINQLEKKIEATLNEANVDFSKLEKIENFKVEIDNEQAFFGMKPFYLNVNVSAVNQSSSSLFSFSAPTTKKNLFRVLSAMSLDKAVLLEGPPGMCYFIINKNVQNY